MSYFVFEGVDGVGKTTTMQNVARKLIELGHDIVLTKEPGGPTALEAEWNFPGWAHDYYGFRYEGFRGLCVNNPHIPGITKRGLFRADAFYNWEAVVKPALAEKKIVLSDRSWVSDLAYGHALTGVSLARLYEFNTVLVPEQTGETNVIYLELPSEERERRLSTNVTNELDKLGKEKRDAIAAAYDETLRLYVPEFMTYRIDTSAQPEDVAGRIVEIILAQ